MVWFPLELSSHLTGLSCANSVSGHSCAVSRSLAAFLLLFTSFQCPFERFFLFSFVILCTSFFFFKLFCTRDANAIKKHFPPSSSLVIFIVVYVYLRYDLFLSVISNFLFLFSNNRVTSFNIYLRLHKMFSNRYLWHIYVTPITCMPVWVIARKKFSRPQNVVLGIVIQ